MKKTILTLMTLVALVMCGCEQGPNDPGGNGNNTNPDEPTIDITPYLGKYLMSRHTELSINVLGMFSFPLDKDLDVEMVTVKSDPAVENGVIISNNDALICTVLLTSTASILKTTRSIWSLTPPSETTPSTSVSVSAWLTPSSNHR